MREIPIRTLEFEVQQYMVSAMIADDLLQHIDPSQVRMHLQYHIRHLAHILTASFKVPGQKLPRQLVAEYPATWWEHLKARLGRKHKTMRVYREDTAVFPNIPIPERYASCIRICTHYAEPELCTP